MNPSDFENMASQIDVPKTHLKYILEQIELYIPDSTVWAFGSRVKGSNRSTSDLDLAVLCDKETARKQLPALNEVFVESDIPFKIQLLDFNRLPENMQDNIKEKYIILYTSGDREI